MIAFLNSLMAFVGWSLLALLCLVYADSDRTQGWKQWVWLTGAVICGTLGVEVWL